MYSRANRVTLLLVWVLATFAAPSSVQTQESRASGKTASRAAKSLDQGSAQSSLLNASEGLSVIGTALESRVGGLSKLDCSHLVHTIYERAGFPYSYASSSGLYAGTDEFQRVARPHAGDLVVWPGHVGIVVNPAENTFFSALRSGTGVESYSSPYWKERGTPRFYRYTKVGATNGRVHTAGTPAVTRTTLDAPADTESKLPVEGNLASVKFPQVQVIDSAKPQSREVTLALLQSLSAGPEGLSDADAFRLARPLIVFSQLEVRAIKIHGHQGQAQVRITRLLLLDNGKVNLKQRQETQTWSFRWRDRKSWELLLPQDAIYIPREAAVRMLAHQLSRLADEENPSDNLRQKSQLAQMLNAILVD